MLTVFVMGHRAAFRRKEAGQAKPARVAMTLEREIRTGKLGFGDRLQSESELVERFAVSRTTIRKSLEALADKGLITKKTGIGSFVTFDGATIDSALGWTRALANCNVDVATKLTKIGIVTDPALALLLQQDLSRFIAVDRIRWLKDTGEVISIERSRIPFLDELKNVKLDASADGAVSNILREGGLTGDSGEEWADIEYLSVEDAAQMCIPAGSPVLHTRRLVRDTTGRVIEYVSSLLHPKHFALHLVF